MTARTRRIAVIGTGGSIATMGRDSLDFAEYIDFGAKIEIDALLEMFPEARGGFELLPVPFRRIDSKAVSGADWLELNRAIGEVVECDAPIDGVVVTHGTATLEETAYFLHLAVKVDVPVVVVGSMRPPNGLSSDAGLNLVNAVRVAASPAARGLGVLVVLNDEIQSAREVTKSRNYRAQTFEAPDFGMLGYADPDGTVAIYRRPTRRHAPDTEFEAAGLAELPRADVVGSYAEADGRMIEALVAAGSRAIVHAGLPPGGPTPAEREALAEAAANGVLVVQASLAGGRVVETTKGREAGFVAADTLTPRKARVLAKLALTASEETAEIRRMFREY